MSNANDSKLAPKMGRPSMYTPELAERVADLYASGITVAEVCRQAGISDERFYTWQQSREDFASALARARAARATAKAEMPDQILAAVELDVRNTEMDVRRSANLVKIADRKVAVAQWHASKLDPGTWGERLQMDVSGSLDTRGIIGVPLASQATIIEASGVTVRPQGYKDEAKRLTEGGAEPSE